MTEHTRAAWTAYLIATLGIAALAFACLASRANDFDHEQMVTTRSIVWELR